MRVADFRDRDGDKVQTRFSKKRKTKTKKKKAINLHTSRKDGKGFENGEMLRKTLHEPTPAPSIAPPPVFFCGF